MGVEQLITDLWPNTETLLLANTESDYATAKLRAIDTAIATLYATVNPSITPIPTLAEIDAGNILLQQYVAEAAVLLLMPMARDYYMQTSASISESYTPGGSSSVTRYNRIETLNALEKALIESLKNRKPLIIDIIGLPADILPIPTYFGVARVNRPIRPRKTRWHL